MKFIADLHIHSHFSRATSKTLNPENLSLWARKKGITVVGTGDFTHPGWIAELQEKLIESGDGLYCLKPELQKTVDFQTPASCMGHTRFLLSGEISCIYKKNGKTRKVHHLILMPDMESVRRLNRRLDQIGNIHSDGRPILGLDSRDLLEITLEASDRAFFIPAHVWTPWFSVFGSKSGFDTLEECFEDLTPHIHALETGLSSDPPMNRCLSMLDPYLLVSNSDAHSPAKLGREANIFDTDLKYQAMIQAMTDGKGFMGTLEFYPEEGKYHLDGHRKCRVRFEPSETTARDGLCPVCGKPLTVGVLNRVNELADRRAPKLSKDFFSLVPLPEILSQLLDCGPATKKVSGVYEKLLSDLGPELRILMDTPLSELETAGGPLLKEAIDRMRSDRVIREGGYDGEFGVIRMFHDSEKESLKGQLALFTQEVKKKFRPAAPLPRDKQTFKIKKKTVSHKTTQFKDPILDPLNSEQRSAVVHQKGHLVVVAGPGTGKTLTLTHRIGYLVREGIAEPDRILALTFTRKAAEEMRQRLSNLMPGPDSGKVIVSTFHRFCLDILRQFGEKIGLPSDFSVCSESDSERLVSEFLAESGVKGPGRRFLKAFRKMKTGLTPGTDDGPFEPELLALLETYQSKLRHLGMLDLDDLETEALGLFRAHEDVSRFYANQFPRIFVDEYQDTNPMQAALLVSLISAGQATLCAIGDPDQAIYGFRGADVNNFYRFVDDFPGANRITLKKNYRSSESILKGAAGVMGNAKSLQCMTTEDSPILLTACRTEAEEAEMIVEQVERLLGGTTHFSLDSGRVSSHEGERSLSFGDMGVLYRLNAQADALEKALNRAGIPFVRSGEAPLISRYPVNILHRFFQTRQHPNHPYYAGLYSTLLKEHHMEKKDPWPSTGISDSLQNLVHKAVNHHGFDLPTEVSVKSLDRLKKLAEDFQGGVNEFMDTLSLERGIDHGELMGDRLSLMSLHGAKGLEWPVVFIVGCEDRLLPCNLFGNRDGDEESRLFYVGMTRAQDRLILSHVSRRALNGRVLDMKASPFLDSIPSDYCRSLDRGAWKAKKRPPQQLTLF